ncbi:uncharacterized protein LOC135199001 [Macrobrachium nipponense]|uniref:uncharacterized protein LOC135199001 n=1 Tax=Macrobrachium nipponense TaxID=159736 RepID=UPI0030C8612E
MVVHMEERLEAVIEVQIKNVKEDAESSTLTEWLQCSFRQDLPQCEGPELPCSGLDDNPSLSYSRLTGDDTPHGTRLPEGNYTLDSGHLDQVTEVHSQNASCGSASSNYNAQHQFLPYLRGQGNATELLPYSRETEMSSGGHNEVLKPLPIMGGEFGESASAGYAPEEEILRGDLDGASVESAFEGTDDSTGRGGSGCTELSLTRRHPLQRMRTPTSSRDRGPKSWEFLMNLLADSRYNPSLIKWDDEQRFIFRLVKPCEVAEMWASRKGQNNGIDKNNFARNLRYFYKDGTLQAVKEKQYVYGCGTKAIQFYKNLLFSER